MNPYREFDRCELEEGFYVCRLGKREIVAGGPYNSPLEARVMEILFNEALELGIATFPGEGRFYAHRVYHGD